jgi:deazaflavin-dependent oxidoreductase (nitroreductase family)
MSSRNGRPKHYLTLRGRTLRYWVRIHLWVYRTTKGRVLYKMRGMPSLLLTTTGRRSGRAHIVPLPYLREPAGGAGKIVVGSFAGSDHDPAWVLNLRADPAVGVQDRGDVYAGRATVLAGDERAGTWARLVETSPWYASYQAATSREIPLVRLDRAETRGPTG